MDTSREASFIAVKLRRIADRFRQVADTGWVPGSFKIEGAAGRLIIRAWELRCLDGIEGLARLVAWVKDPDQANNESIMVPCPASLFIEFCGFHGEVVRIVDNRIVRVPGEHCGVLPRLLPEILTGVPAQDLPQRGESLSLHYSEVCEWLANEVGKAGGMAGIAKGQAPHADIPGEVLESQHDDVTEYLGVKLDLPRRRVSGCDATLTRELDPIQTAVLLKCLKSGESWVTRAVIEAAISKAKTQPGHPPHKSEDPLLVDRAVSKLRRVLAPFGRTIKNDRSGGYRIEMTEASFEKPPRKSGASRRKGIGKKRAS